MKIGQSLEESGSLIQGISETIKNGTREEKIEFVGMLLCTYGSSLLENLF